MLTVSGLVNVLVKINDVEVPISVTPTAGAHKDGSLRSIVVQFQYDVPPTGIAATLQLGTVRSQHMSAQPIPSMPDAVALPTDPNYLIATELVGPTTSQATSKAMGGACLKYENDLVTYADKHWTTYGFDWASTNYYDRVQLYYAWWVRTGNPEYWRRATLTAMDYRHEVPGTQQLRLVAPLVAAGRDGGALPAHRRSRLAASGGPHRGHARLLLSKGGSGGHQSHRHGEPNPGAIAAGDPAGLGDPGSRVGLHAVLVGDAPAADARRRSSRRRIRRAPSCGAATAARASTT
ncbi:MAG: hypothetical protein IPK33_24710 [Gemmatimonadetes bacterium]|nr:hypothetical protein [Gemmatimonadota bacterium]